MKPTLDIPPEMSRDLDARQSVTELESALCALYRDRENTRWAGQEWASGLAQAFETIRDQIKTRKSL